LRLFRSCAVLINLLLKKCTCLEYAETGSCYRQAIVASGDAAKAALDAVAFLRGID